MPTIAGVQYPKGWTPGSVVTFDDRTGTVVDRAPQEESTYGQPLGGYWFWVTPTGADFRETVRVWLNSKTGHAREAGTDGMYLDARARRSVEAHARRAA